jgi:TolB protein
MRYLGLFALLLAVCGCATQKDPTERELARKPVQLTRGFERAGEAYFSPDQQWIIFQAVPKGQHNYQMYLARLQWKNGAVAGAGLPIRISPDDSRNTCGFFSPDGQSLIFASTAGKEKPDEPTGGYQRQGRNYRWSFPTGMEIFKYDHWLYAMAGLDSLDHVNLATNPLTNNDVYDAECAFSPDGKWICFTRGAGADADIHVMKSDRTRPVQITTARGYDGGPFFSPDGKRLVYRSDRKGDDLLQIFTCDLVFDAEGNITGAANERQLTDDGDVNWGPYWHPDGKHIVYATSRHGHTNYEIYLIDDNGGNPTRVTYHEGADVLPVFSPDGKWLMWTSKRSADGSAQVFIGRFAMPEAK